jgi:hypothetical protein
MCISGNTLVGAWRRAGSVLGWGWPVTVGKFEVVQEMLNSFSWGPFSRSIIPTTLHHLPQLLFNSCSFFTWRWSCRNNSAFEESTSQLREGFIPRKRRLSRYDLVPISSDTKTEEKNVNHLVASAGESPDVTFSCREYTFLEDQFRSHPVGRPWACGHSSGITERHWEVGNSEIRKHGALRVWNEDVFLKGIFSVSRNTV